MLLFAHRFKTFSGIIKDTGVSNGTFYMYFKDKYDIRNHLSWGFLRIS